MFYYFWDFKKIFGIGFIVLIVLSILGYFSYFKFFHEEKDLTVNISGSTIKIDNNFSKNKENINKYYQIYIYPSIYKITCESKDKSICDKINEKSFYLKNYPLSFLGQDLKNGFTGQIDLTGYFLDKDKNTQTLLDLTKSLFVGYEGKSSTGYEKYFEFKKKNPSDKVVLNQMEIVCFEGIKNSITPGTYDEENILTQKTKESCTTYGNLNSMELSYGGETPKGNSEVKVKLEISELKIIYKIFKKDGLNYKQDSEKMDLISKNIIFDGIYTNKEIFGN